MPCDSISTASVVWTQATDLNLLVAALNTLGKQATLQGDTIRFTGGTFRAGQFTFQGSAFLGQMARMTDAKAAEALALVKRAYSGEVVKSQAKRFGWQLKETAPFKYEVMKR